MSDSYIGDYGTQIIVDTGASLAAATVKKLKIKKPDGTTVTKNADVTDLTKLLYSAGASDLDLVGIYIVQAYIEFSDWKGHGAPAYFTVNPLAV